MAAPCSSGRHSTGAAVLSMISGTPSSRPILATSRDREDRELRIGQRLGVVAAGLGVGGAAEILRIGGIDEAALDAHRAHRVREQVPGAAVEVGRADEIVAGVADVLHREQRGRLARGQRQRRDAAFERGDALLQHGLRRVHDAGVDVAELLEREQVGGMLGRIELVGRRLIDRHRDRVGRRIGAIAGMQHDGFSVRTGRWHWIYPRGSGQSNRSGSKESR